MVNIRDHVAEVPNFPKRGVTFYDISGILANPAAWAYTIDTLAEAIAPHRPKLLAGIESRGFLLAAPLAYKLGCGFILIRKRGRLPGRTISYTYDLEYGTDTLEIQSGRIETGDTVVAVDDILATGGTLSASVKLLHQCGATVPMAAGIMELSYLGGRERLGLPFHALMAI
jgi:adenine phosphoribosyltransferase